MIKKRFNKFRKNITIADVQFIKLSVFFFAFWIASFIDINYIVGWRWIWFGLFLLFGAKPIWKFLKR